MKTGISIRWRDVATALLLLALAGLARAGDRPFLATSSAAAEEDDDAVWSIESWWQRVGGVRILSLAPEYAFNPTTSLQFELSTARDRGEASSERGAEFELKHLFNHIARDGYGWGVVASLGFDKSQGAAWHHGSTALKLPFTLALWEGDGALHLNAGWSKARGDRRQTTWSLAVEREVFKRTMLFAEAAREGDAKLLHAGMRWWLKKEKFALDVAASRTRVPGTRETGWVVGLGWYDL